MFLCKGAIQLISYTLRGLWQCHLILHGERGHKITPKVARIIWIGVNKVQHNKLPKTMQLLFLLTNLFYLSLSLFFHSQTHIHTWRTFIFYFLTGFKMVDVLKYHVLWKRHCMCQIFFGAFQLTCFVKQVYIVYFKNGEYFWKAYLWRKDRFLCAKLGFSWFFTLSSTIMLKCNWKIPLIFAKK